MMRNRFNPLLIAAAVTASLVILHLVLGQPPSYAQSSSGSYTLRKQEIGAGEVSSAGSYRLTGTVAEVGAAVSGSPRFRLTGGFHGATSPFDSIFCDGFENAACN